MGSARKISQKLSESAARLVTAVSNENDTRKPLEKHIDYFGGPRPQGHGISYTSMKKRNLSLGDTPAQAKKRAFKVSFGGGLANGCPFSHFQPSKAAKSLRHKQSTRFYKADGTFDEDLWNAFTAQYAPDGRLTESKFYEFLNVCRQKETDSNAINRSFGKKASDGEWTGYWDIFSEKNADGTRFVLTEKLKQFYLDSSIPGKEIEEKVQRARIR